MAHAVVVRFEEKSGYATEARIVGGLVLLSGFVDDEPSEVAFTPSELELINLAASFADDEDEVGEAVEELEESEDESDDE